MIQKDSPMPAPSPETSPDTTLPETLPPETSPPETSRPELAVIIPSVNSYDDLDGCLRALEADQGARITVIVVDRLGEHVRHWVRKDHPGTVVIAVPPGTPIPQMRAIGIRKATASAAPASAAPAIAVPAIAVIEDHVIVPPGWARAMLDALDAGADVAGGAVDNAATGTWVDWSAFLCEYSGTLPPLPAGPSDWLPGNNVIYRTAVLVRHDAVLDEGKWENRLHDAIRAGGPGFAGSPLMLHPEIVVVHKMHYSFGLYMAQRYLYSRSYAGAMRDGMPKGKQIVMGAAALIALPPLMFLRTIQRIRAKRRYPRELIRALPLLVPFCLSWGAGEAAGYWFGPGRAMSRVR